MGDFGDTSDWPHGKEPVAIVGFSFRFGGEASSTEAFWDMITNGRCAVSPIPEDRFNAASFYHTNTNRLDRLPVKYGNFISENIAAFDAPFFNIKPEEAAAMDPQSRKLLQATYHALENAGIDVETVAGTNTCVFTGISADDYRLMYAKDPAHASRYAATGMAPSMLANKISWFYDLKGPSVQLDTACSASLNATHLAVRSIQSGESEMGIVGGANLYITPESLAPLAHQNFFSPDHRCHSFDHRANGYSRGDGYGVLILKPLSKALRDRDPIRAIIRSTASNENGRTTGGITKVNLEAQKRLINTAYDDANVDRSLTRYVEAHAPGTQGDIVETTALASVFRSYRRLDSRLYMGSVKANLGHMEGTSGIASLVKVILMLERGIIPRLANFEMLHPEIRADDWCMAFPTENVPWPAGVRQASVNSFGFGGANAHIVLQGTHGTPEEEAQHTEDSVAQQSDHPYLLVWSTADEAGMKRSMETMRKYLAQKTDITHDFLRQLAYTLCCRRTTLAWKSALVVSASRREETEINLEDISKPLRLRNVPPLVFVLTGQGAAWAGMATQFMYNATFRKSIDRCTAYFHDLGATWNLLDELEKQEGDSRVRDADLSQPLCTAIQIAMIDMLQSFKIMPAHVVGHSSGEIAAAYATGAISTKSACKIAYLRGHLIARHFTQAGVYGMLVVGLGQNDIATHLDQLQEKGVPLNVHVACVNSPRNVTLSGCVKELRSLKEAFERDSVFVRELSVPAPYHSPILASMSEEYAQFIGEIEPGTSSGHAPVMISSVTRTKTDASQLRQAAYWTANLLSPVEFSSAIDNTIQHIHNASSDAGKNTTPCFVEVGPHGALRTAIRDTLKDSTQKHDLQYFSVVDRGQVSADRMFHTIGQLHCLGFAIDLAAVNAVHKIKARCLTDLPEYPFNQSLTYWHESQASKSHRFRTHPPHDLLGSRVKDWSSHWPRWRHRVRRFENPWVVDHRLGGALIYPGAGMVVMAIEAAAQYVRDFTEDTITGFQLSDVVFHSALNISDTAEGDLVEMALIPSAERLGRSEVPTSMKFSLGLQDEGSWRKVSTGEIAVEFADLGQTPALIHERKLEVEQIASTIHARSAKCTKKIDRKRLYQDLHKFGLDLGPTFQVFDDITYDEDGSVAMVDIRPRNWAEYCEPSEFSSHTIHPTALDGFLQSLIVALGAGSKEKVPSVAPSRIGKAWISADGLSGANKIRAVTKSELFGLRHTRSDVLAYDPLTNMPKVTLKGLEAITIESSKGSDADKEKLTAFTMEWQNLVCQPKLDKVPVTTKAGVVIVDVSTTVTQSKIEILKSTKDQLLSQGINVFQSYRTMKDLDNNLSGMSAKKHFICIDHEGDSSSTLDLYHKVRKIFAQSLSIMWVTITDAGRLCPSSHGAVVGLSRTIRTEHAGYQFVTLEYETSSEESGSGGVIVEAFQASRLDDARTAYEPELRYALSECHKSLQVPRLAYSPMHATTINGTGSSPESLYSRSFRGKGLPNVELKVISPGLLDSLTFEECADPPAMLEPDQVHIQTAFVGLNFLDVLTALGRIPQNSVLGIEATGFVTQCGSQTDFAVDDAVVVLTDGTLRSNVTANHLTAIKLPTNVSLADAASLAGTACTAYRAFVDIAHLMPRETVLIHAGAGATGQMAIQLALHLGAEVFTTVGSDTKRELLESQYGIPSDHIFNSRDKSFAKGIMRMTGAKGVDVVLNSLAGDLLDVGWSEIMAPFGRWIEIGKRDIIDKSRLNMGPFMDNVTFSCVDLTGIWRGRPSMMRTLFTNVFDLASKGVLKAPKPVSIFGVDEIQDAFRSLQAGKTGGKVVIDMGSQQSLSVRKSLTVQWRLKPDRTYLIVGGLGGLGREVVRWLSRRGAKFIAILSRSDYRDDELKRTLVQDVEARGSLVRVFRGDVADRAALLEVLDICQKEMPPIAGCVQASMVLRVSTA